MKSSQRKTQVSPVAVPEPLKGKRAAIFFLLNEIGLRKKRPANAGSSEETAPNATESSDVINLQSKVLLLTDEFIFS